MHFFGIHSKEVIQLSFYNLNEPIIKCKNLLSLESTLDWNFFRHTSLLKCNLKIKFKQMLRCLFLCISNFEWWECSKMAKQTCYYLSTQWLLSCKFQLINKSLKFLSPFLLPFKVGISQTNLFIIGMGTSIPVFLSFCPANLFFFSFVNWRQFVLLKCFGMF